MRHRMMSLAQMTLAVFTCLAVLVNTASAQTGAFEKAYRKDSSQDDGYVTLAGSLASPLFRTIEEARQGFGDPAVMLRMEIARQRLTAMSPSNTNASQARAGALAHLDDCHLAMEELRRLDASTPDFQGLANKALTASAGLGKKSDERDAGEQRAVDDLAAKAVTELGTVLYNAWQSSTQREKYRTHYRAARYVGANLKAMAERRCDAPRASSSIFAVEFDGSWDAIYDSDELHLRNDSGRDLTDCTIAVSITGMHGDKLEANHDRHLHYISRWPAGEWRIARYMASSAGGIASDESVDIVEHVTIEVYSNEYRDTINYDYANTPEYDTDVERFFKANATKFYLSFSEENFLSNAGVWMTHDSGASSIPIRWINVRAKDGFTTKAVNFSAGRTWNSGYFGGKSLKSTSFNGMKPNSVEVEFRFAGSSYKPTLTWDLTRN